MKNEPLISIIVNCFNGEKYLRNALDSIYQQTYKNWEIIFLDNHSSDKSAEIAKEYDSRLKYFKNEENVTLGRARRLALEYARGEWIAFLDVDDIWHNDRLMVQIQFLDEVSDADLLYAAVEKISYDGRFITVDEPVTTGKVHFSDLLMQFDINMVTPLVSRYFLTKYNLTFDDTMTASEEYNLFMRCAVLGNVYRLSNILGKYRVSDDSLTDKKINNWAKERFKTISECIQLNPELLNQYPELFIEAIQRGIYYEACYAMHCGRMNEARGKLRGLGVPKIIYFFLYTLSFSRFAWRAIHRKRLKGILTLFLRKLSFIRDK